MDKGRGLLRRHPSDCCILSFLIPRWCNTIRPNCNSANIHERNAVSGDDGHNSDDDDDNGNDDNDDDDDNNNNNNFITRKYFDVMVGLAWSNDPQSYAGGDLATGKASHATRPKVIT